MKTSILKISLNSLFLLLILSCSKENESLETGSLVGKIRLYDLYSQESFIYSDIQINVTSSTNESMTITVDSSGNFKIDNIATGETLLEFNKPEYGGIGSISMLKTIDVDTISDIVLLEDIPFSYTIEEIELVDNMIYWSGSIDYTSEEDYLVGTYFFFSKQPNVSCNNYEFEFLPGTFKTVAAINGTIRTGATLNIADLINSGFNYGDTVYITAYMTNFVSKDVFWGIDNNNFTLITYNFQNQSNIYSLTL
jgi:hypothetical protein